MKQPNETPFNQQWSSEEGLVANDDVRPPQAIPAEGQETHDGWSGFIPAEKFSNQGSTPYKVNN